MLGLGGTVLDGMEQRGIHAGEAGKHLGIAPVALTLMAGDGVELTRIGHQHHGAEVGEITTDPRTVGARFQRDGGAGIIHEQLRQRGPGVGQGDFADDVAGNIEDADVMLPVAEIETEGEPIGDNGRGVGNDGRSSFIFHKAVKLHPTQPLRRATAFSSNLVRRMVCHRLNLSELEPQTV